VNNSAKVLLTKLDSSQQELLQKQDVAKDLLVKINGSQDKIYQQVNQGNEAAARRAVESDTSQDSKMQELTSKVVKVCNESAGQLGKVLEMEMGNVTKKSAATRDSLNQCMATQDEHIGDLRRQNMMIMDMLTSTQERVSESADTVASFARSSLVHDNSAQIEVAIKGAISQEIGQLASHLQDEMSGGILAAITERLQAGHQSGGSSAGLEQVVRQELSSTAMALLQQQREMAEQQVGQVREEVGQTVRQELKGTSAQLQVQVEKFEGALDEGMARFEQGVQKVMGEKGEKGEKDSRRQNRADRG